MIYKRRFINTETGEFETISLYKDSFKYPKKGSEGVYMSLDPQKMILPVIAELSPKEAVLFEAMIKHRDKYNVVRSTVKKIALSVDLEWSNPYLSGRVKKMRELDLIEKYNGKIFINPYVIKPKFDEDNPDSQFEVQQVWKKLFIDKDAYYESIDDDIKRIFK
jgi:hypothetical protein